MAIKPYRTPTKNGTPFEYLVPASSFEFGAALKQGSTMGGKVGIMTGSTSYTPDFIGYAATTGAALPLIPCLRVEKTQEFICNTASSDAVISTTRIGDHVRLSSSGTAIVGTKAGTFVISGVYNTSDAKANTVTGHFVSVATTI